MSTSRLGIALVAIELAKGSKRDPREFFDDAHALLKAAGEFILVKDKKLNYTQQALVAKGLPLDTKISLTEWMPRDRRIPLVEAMRVARYRDRETFLKHVKAAGKDKDELTVGDAIEIRDLRYQLRAESAQKAGVSSARKRASRLRRKKRREKV